MTDTAQLIMPPLPPPSIQSRIPNKPDFSFLKHNINMISSAYGVVQMNEAWELLANFTGESFMFNTDPAIHTLMIKISDAYGGGHSGSSIAFTMRHLEFIAKHGFAAYKEKIEKIEE